MDQVAQKVGDGGVGGCLKPLPPRGPSEFRDGTLKARLHMRFSMRFWCDFDAILRTKSAPAYPARVYSRVTPRQNTVKLAEIREKGVFKYYVIPFFPIHKMLREINILAG